MCSMLVSVPPCVRVAMCDAPSLITHHTSPMSASSANKLRARMEEGWRRERRTGSIGLRQAASWQSGPAQLLHPMRPSRCCGGAAMLASPAAAGQARCPPAVLCAAPRRAWRGRQAPKRARHQLSVANMPLRFAASLDCINACSPPQPECFAVHTDADGLCFSDIDNGGHPS